MVQRISSWSWLGRMEDNVSSQRVFDMGISGRRGGQCHQMANILSHSVCLTTGSVRGIERNENK